MDQERFTPFVLLIERISKNIKRIADKEMEIYGLRSSHVMCMLQLAKTKNGLSSSALAEACGVDKAFISRVTSELLEKGFIVKATDGAKIYKTNFIPTESGYEIIEKMTSIVKSCFPCDVLKRHIGFQQIANHSIAQPRTIFRSSATKRIL